MRVRRRPRRVPRPPIDRHPRSWHAGYNQGFDDRGRLPCDDPACPRRYGDDTNERGDAVLQPMAVGGATLECDRCGRVFLYAGQDGRPVRARPDLLARQLLEHQC